MLIKNVFARQILDSRGHPTIEVEVTLEGGLKTRASVPSGASTGAREALELRDGGKEFHGNSVQKAILNINEIIAPTLIGRSPLEHENIDKSMIDLDGTENKSKLGANAILGVSMAVFKAAAAVEERKIYEYTHEKYRLNEQYILPAPCMNMMNGGKHAEGSSDFQEYMLIPFASSFKKAIQTSAEVFYVLKETIHKKGLSTLVGDEGGFAPKLDSNRAPLDIMCEAIQSAGYKVGKDFGFALDPAATSFVKKTKDGFMYDLKCEGITLNSEEMTDYYVKLISEYPIVSLEDGLGEDDWEGWKNLYGKIGNDTQVVGDDLFVTNTEMIKKGHELNVANAVLIKLNQIGSVSETIKAINLSRDYHWHTMISHRSGETEDTFIADLSVGLNTLQLKSGSLSRSERVAKYNQLLRIEEELGHRAIYKGRDSFLHHF